MSKFTDRAKAIITAVAPTVGTALGGPFGALAGVVIAKALGVEGAASEEAVNAALLSGDPETLVKLKQAENDFKLKMEELAIKPEQLANEDRANAREREMSVRDRTPAHLAYGVSVGFFSVLLILIFNGAPDKGGDALLVLLGSLGTAWAGIMAYYYGSTKGSADKSKVIADIAKMPV